MTAGASVETYLYSADGMRWQKNSGGVTMTYVRDGQNVLQEVSGSTPSAYYTQMPEEWGGLLSRRDLIANQSSYYGFDPQGNARILVTPGAASPDSYGYTGFGMELGTGAARANPFRFGGQYGYYRDDPFRLYVRARHYSPDKTRWLSPDPLDHVALFDYAYNNPMSYVDPSGLQAYNPNGFDAAEATSLMRLGVDTLKVGGLVPDLRYQQVYVLVEALNAKYGHLRTQGIIRHIQDGSGSPVNDPLAERLKSAIRRVQHMEAFSTKAADFARGLGDDAYSLLDLVGISRTIGLTARAAWDHKISAEQWSTMGRQALHSLEPWAQTSWRGRGQAIGNDILIIAAGRGAFGALSKGASGAGNALRVYQIARSEQGILKEFLPLPLGQGAAPLLVTEAGGPLLAAGAIDRAFAGTRLEPKWEEPIGAVVHLTSPEILRLIRKSGIFYSPKNVGLYVLDEVRVPRSEFLKRATTLSGSAQAPLRITGSAAKAFRRPIPLGPWNLIRRLNSVRFAPSGIVDIKQMKFIPDVIYDPVSRQVVPATQLQRIRPLAHEAIFYGADLLIEVGAGTYVYLRYYYGAGH